MTAQPTPTDLTMRGRRWLKWLWIPLLALIVGIAWWWALHPDGLPHSNDTVREQIKSGQTIYLGVSATDGPARKLKLHSVNIHTSSSTGADVEASAWVCQGGSVARTSTPEPFCEKWAGAKGATLHLNSGDQLVIGISADVPTTAKISSVEVDFTDGLQRGTSRIGPHFEVTFRG